MKIQNKDLFFRDESHGVVGAEESRLKTGVAHETR